MFKRLSSVLLGTLVIASTTISLATERDSKTFEEITKLRLEQVALEESLQRVHDDLAETEARLGLLLKYRKDVKQSFTKNKVLPSLGGMGTAGLITYGLNWLAPVLKDPVTNQRVYAANASVLFKKYVPVRFSKYVKGAPLLVSGVYAYLKLEDSLWYKRELERLQQIPLSRLGDEYDRLLESRLKHLERVERFTTELAHLQDVEVQLIGAYSMGLAYLVEEQVALERNLDRLANNIAFADQELELLSDYLTDYGINVEQIQAKYPLTFTAAYVAASAKASAMYGNSVNVAVLAESPNWIQSILRKYPKLAKSTGWFGVTVSGIYVYIDSHVKNDMLEKIDSLATEEQKKNYFIQKGKRLFEMKSEFINSTNRLAELEEEIGSYDNALTRKLLEELQP